MLLRNSFTRDARVAREASSLEAAGHRVTVLAVGAPGLPAEEERGYRILRAVSPRPLAGPTIRSEAGGGGGRTGIRPPAAVWVRDRMLARRFRRAALRIEADVYHAHDLNTLEPAVAAARARGVRVVYDAHELYPELTGLLRGERVRWARLERRLIGTADAVIAPSESRADEMVARYGIARPVVVMNCPRSAVPDPAVSPLTRLRRPGEGLVVYAGGFSPNRGLDNVVRAASEVPGIARLVLIGWGPLEGSLRTLAADLGDRVTFLPAVAPDEVVGLVAGADVGLAPYLPVGRNNELAAPNKLFEYLHAGLAVAASDLPDIRRVVSEHDVGVLFDASEVGSIARAIRETVSNPERLANMRANARAAAPQYTWEAQERALLGIYERLGRGSAAAG